MEDQKLQSEPPAEVVVIDARIKDGEDEEFYEKIEAPKFVDFTKPYTVRIDDRFWFCSRVGCDQKHEEELNHEEISKNFVLRVMAARSPNIKLRKALNREHLSMKCPLSAPAKPSKSRMPRLDMVSSLISHKNGDPESKIKPSSKVGSTPMANKSRQVASKYMTTPRNKMCRPDLDSFRSVQHPKKTTIYVNNRTIAKALAFYSPKKAIRVKKSVELHTPLKNICNGTKRLEIASQKKTSKGTQNKPKKQENEDASRSHLKVCKSAKKSKALVPSNASNSHALRGDTKDSTIVDDKKNVGCDEKSSNEVVAGQMDDDVKEDALNLEDKENMGSAEVAEHMNDDGKENALIRQNSNRSGNQPLGDKIISKEMHKKNKVVQTSGPVGMKCKKPKPTNVKPFRLRTDERGILREAIVEKKLHDNAPEKEVLKDTSIIIKRTYRVPKSDNVTTKQRKHNDSTKVKCEKEPSAVGSKPVTNRAQKRPESTQQRLRLTTSLRTKSPQGGVSPKKVRMQGQQLGVIKEKSCKLTTDVMVTENKTRPGSAARSTSRGKRPLTIAKEPNFHTSHTPKTCSKISR
ncbi:uncharacterized protein [Rutidosis leptorrhynchoides]|uniref:uncharacterized protein n=1 Tax=Rutidosis leptorrhynchoides TaxID=125765 RepID=UPI003A9A29C3